MQTRTMETEVDVENGSGILKPGMFASAVLVTQHKDSALTLPTQAISRSGDQAFALVVGAGKKLEQRKLVLGIEAPDRVEVISGIQAGEQAILGNQTQFQPGQVIQPKPVSQSTAENGKG
jgi:multidrug efflux pump subunit AcrA (membrane-fusion protein)